MGQAIRVLIIVPSDIIFASCVGIVADGVCSSQLASDQATQNPPTATSASTIDLGASGLAADLGAGAMASAIGAANDAQVGGVTAGTSLAASADSSDGALLNASAGSSDSSDFGIAAGFSATENVDASANIGPDQSAVGQNALLASGAGTTGSHSLGTAAASNTAASSGNGLGSGISGSVGALGGALRGAVGAAASEGRGNNR